MAVEVPENVVVTKLDAVANWCRKNSLWPMPFATACCGIELMATGASRHDLARFGAVEWPRKRYLAGLKKALACPTRTGLWRFEEP